MQDARVRGGMPGVASCLSAVACVLLLIWGQNIGVWCADFFPLVILLSFSLDMNNLGDETGKALAQALTTNTTLKELKYGGEMPGLLLCLSAVACVLLLALGQNIGVCCADFFPLLFCFFFSLNNNSFGDETGKALAQALTTNTTLTWLKYGGGMPGVASLRVLLLVWGQNIGVCCADFSPLSFCFLQSSR